MAYVQGNNVFKEFDNNTNMVLWETL